MTATGFTVGLILAGVAATPASLQTDPGISAVVVAPTPDVHVPEEPELMLAHRALYQRFIEAGTVDTIACEEQPAAADGELPQR